VRYSKAIDVDDSLGKGLRGFLKQIVPYAALDDPVLVFSRELLGIGTALQMRSAVSNAADREW
jgi:hypothetical protein